MIESVKYENQLFMGDGFSSRYYVYFDISNKQIGMAKNKEALSYNNVYQSYSNLDDEDIAFFDALKWFTTNDLLNKLYSLILR